jgi:hypothetical protein
LPRFTTFLISKPVTMKTNDETEEAPEKYLGKFIFTAKTATFQKKTLQLSNVVNIEVRSFFETKKAVYIISEEHKDLALKVLAAGVVLFFLRSIADVFATVGVLLGLGGGGVLGYYFYERNRKKDKTRNFYGLFFHCTSGKNEVLWFDSQQDVVMLFDRITNSMNQRDSPNFIASFTDNRIVIHESENVMVNSKIDAGGNVVVGNS